MYILSLLVTSIVLLYSYASLTISLQELKAAEFSVKQYQKLALQDAIVDLAWLAINPDDTGWNNCGSNQTETLTINGFSATYLIECVSGKQKNIHVTGDTTQEMVVTRTVGQNQTKELEALWTP